MQGIEITLLFIYNNNFIIVNLITYLFTYVGVHAHACINAHACCGKGAVGSDTNCLMFYQVHLAFYVSLLENYLLSIKWKYLKLNRDLRLKKNNMKTKEISVLVTVTGLSKFSLLLWVLWDAAKERQSYRAEWQQDLSVAELPCISLGDDGRLIKAPGFYYSFTLGLATCCLPLVGELCLCKRLCFTGLHVVAGRLGGDGGLRLLRQRTNCEGKFSLITLVVLTLHNGGYCGEGFSCLRSSA